MSTAKHDPTRAELYLIRSGWEKLGDSDSWVDRHFGPGNLPDFPLEEALRIQRTKDLERMAFVLNFDSAESLLEALARVGLFRPQR